MNEWEQVLAAAFTPKWLAMYAWVATVCYVHFRGQVRHPFFRQVSDHSTIVAPINAVIYAFSSVPRTPLLDLKYVPELKILQDNWQVIRDEAVKLYGIGGIGKSDQLDDLGFNSFFKTGWRRFYFHWYGDFLPSAKEQCPNTVELLKQCPSVHAAMFTLLAPGSCLPKHRDPFAGSLRYHLGLITPNSDQCRIFVDGQQYYWRDGEAVLFDETYIHVAENLTDQTRIILFCDVERPLWSWVARKFSHMIAYTLASATASRNRPDEPLGVLNRLFKYVYQLRIIGKRMKAENQRLYYIFKYTLFGALLYWILF